MEQIFSAINLIGKEKYSNKLVKYIEYGTAGFREKAGMLPHIMYRMGVLAVLRSKALKGATIGVMITASHNPEEDNGVKLCDPYGEMLEPEWEVFATKIANSKDENLIKELENIMRAKNIVIETPANVFLARDTRYSSPELSHAVLEGVKAFGGEIKDYGILTTPQLHFMVCCKNKKGEYGTETPEGYYKKLSKAFLNLQSEKAEPNVKYKSIIYIDGANGVGSLALKQLLPFLKDSLKIQIFNDGSSGKLNHMCGADYVKVQQRVPEGAEIISGNPYASLDGDADRLIYFYVDSKKVFHMLDGDKIAVLIAKYLKQIIDKLRMNLELYVVQTAYANGSSTYYIKNVLKIPVACVPTGVKHLHHEAKKHDIGVYFEANGHGTVVFQDSVKRKLKDFVENSENVEDTQKKMARKLLNIVDVINETVGDAISDMLLVETILHDLDWDISDWNELYTDLPNRQLKVKVSDRRMITTTDAERVCVEPVGLQEAINSLVKNYKKARAFVRPSGTEDIVRVYAEANYQADADSLAEQISFKVQEFIGVK